jgi:hypothetical protein
MRLPFYVAVIGVGVASKLAAIECALKEVGETVPGKSRIDTLLRHGPYKIREHAVGGGVQAGIFFGDGNVVNAALKCRSSTVLLVRVKTARATPRPDKAGPPDSRGRLPYITNL